MSKRNTLTHTASARNGITTCALAHSMCAGFSSAISHKSSVHHATWVRRNGDGRADAGRSGLLPIYSSALRHARAKQRKQQRGVRVYIALKKNTHTRPNKLELRRRKADKYCVQLLALHGDGMALVWWCFPTSSSPLMAYILYRISTHALKSSAVRETAKHKHQHARTLWLTPVSTSSSSSSPAPTSRSTRAHTNTLVTRSHTHTRTPQRTQHIIMNGSDFIIYVSSAGRCKRAARRRSLDDVNSGGVGGGARCTCIVYRVHRTSASHSTAMRVCV